MLGCCLVTPGASLAAAARARNVCFVPTLRTGERDFTLASASRLALVLGYERIKTGPPLTEPLADPTPTTLQRRDEGLPPPAFAEARGRGRRVDLEAARDG